jgi:hypothetical protein
VRNAVLANALDSKRDDQKSWMREYGRMVGLPDLIGDE